MAAATDSNIVIIGGGIIGVCTAYYLSTHPSLLSSSKTTKTKITLLEGTSIAAAASGRAGGLLAKWAYPDCLAGLSFDLHEELANKFKGRERWGYRRVTCGQISADTTAAKQSSNGIEARSRSKPNKKHAWPDDLDWLNQETVSEYDQVESSDATAQVHPRLFTQAIADEAVKNGVEIVLGRATKINMTTTTSSANSNSSSSSINDTVTSIDYIPQDQPSSSSSSSSTTKTLVADTVILAAGPWSQHLLPSLPLKTQRAHSLVIRTPHNTVSPYALFTTVNTAQGQFAPEIYARPDGTIYTCGETDSLVTLPLSAADVQVDVKRCDELFSQVAGMSDVIKQGEVIARQACYLPNVRGGGGPIVGRTTKVQGLIIATGHTCWGIQNSAATGKLVSELVFDGQAKSADISELDPARWDW